MIRLKNMVIGVSLVFFSVLCGCLVLEVGIRALGLYEFPDDNFVESHSELGWAHIPSKEGYWRVDAERVFVRINSKGLRDREIEYEKPKDTFRILLLGDSFVEGLQVPLEETFAKQLESRLNQTGRGCEVINAGLGGVGTDYGLVFLRKEGYRYKPDLVLLGFFAGNDIQDNFRSKEILTNEDALLAYEKRGPIVRLRQFLAAHSCAYNYLGLVIPSWAPGMGKILMQLGLLSSQPVNDQGPSETRPWLVYAQDYPRDFEQAWEVTERLISALAKEAERLGSAFAIFTIPSREQVYPRLWDELISKPAFKESNWDWEKPDRRLTGLASEKAVPLLSLLAPFREYGVSKELYYHNDGHWNALGNRLASEIVYTWLTREGLVPLPPDD